MIDNQQVNL